MFSFNSQINVSHLNNIYGDDVTIVKIMFESFLEDSLPIWDDIQAKLQQKNFAVIGGLAHQFKPCFSMIGFPDISPKIHEYELYAKGNPTGEELIRRYNELSPEVAKVKEIVIEELKRMEEEGI